MSKYTDVPMSPRDGHTFMSLLIARISGCTNQKEESLEDQIDHGKEETTEKYDSGLIEYKIVATKGKGENLERPELAEIESLFHSKIYDLCVIEDLSRLIRGGDAARLLGIAVDNGVRVICPNDGIDTVDPAWEEDALNASADNVAYNSHTSKRIKHKTMNRFRKYGGAIAREIAGFNVPDDAKTYAEWTMDPLATPIIRHGLKILSDTLNGENVAEYFNGAPYGGAVGYPTGPYRRTRHTWTGSMVLMYYRNRLLGGMPQRGARHTVKLREKGRRVSVPNPAGPSYFACPHLAHVDLDVLDEVITRVNAKTGNMKRKLVNGQDPLKGVSRKRAHFPGRHGRCWYCGHYHVWGGNGITDNLMCNNAREWHCWNSIGYHGALATAKVVESILDQVDGLDKFDAQFRSLVAAATHDNSGNLTERREKLRRDELAWAASKQNAMELIKKLGDNPIVLQTIESLQIAREKCDLQRIADQTLELPASTAELGNMLRNEFNALAIGSFEMGALLEKLVPEFHVYLVRLIDGGHLMPRAKVRLALDGFIPDSKHVPGLPELLKKELTIDLFVPPQRERIRPAAVALAAQGLGPKEIARRICAEVKEKPTSTAVQNALALHKKMIAAGLQNPYVMILEPPEDYPKFRRHKNKKFKFQQLAGYVQPLL